MIRKSNGVKILDVKSTLTLTPKMNYMGVNDLDGLSYSESDDVPSLQDVENELQYEIDDFVDRAVDKCWTHKFYDPVEKQWVEFEFGDGQLID
jgi:hypothetical protein